MIDRERLLVLQKFPDSGVPLVDALQDVKLPFWRRLITRDTQKATKRQIVRSAVVSS